MTPLPPRLARGCKHAGVTGRFAVVARRRRRLCDRLNAGKGGAIDEQLAAEPQRPAFAHLNPRCCASLRAHNFVELTEQAKPVEMPRLRCS